MTFCNATAGYRASFQTFKRADGQTDIEVEIVNQITQLNASFGRTDMFVEISM